MVQDLSHVKVTPPASQPNRGLGSPWATGSDPAQLASAFKLGPVKGAAESAAEVEAAKQAAAAQAAAVAQTEVSPNGGSE